jgi:hypothetical protein
VPPIALFPFRYRDGLTGRWVRARYKATREDITAAGYAKWEITGPAEIRDPQNDGRYFHPFPIMSHAELMRTLEPRPDMAPVVDAMEAFLVRVFLRRYVTWCARARHYDRVPGAAALFRRLA